MKKPSSLLVSLLLFASFSFANPVTIQHSQQSKTEKKDTKKTEKKELKKEVKKVPVKKTTEKKDKVAK